MNKVLTILLLVLITSAAAAQDSTHFATDSTTTKAPLYRNPQKARVLSFIPGWGYAYTGEYVRGYGTWVMTFVGVTVGPIIFSSDTCGFIFITQCSKSDRVANMLTGSLITIVGLSTYVSSIRDAPRSAERANERHRRREVKAHPIVEISPQSVTQLRAGLRVDW